MTESRPLRVLHCPSLVGGFGPALARAERQLGIDSYSVAYAPNYLGFVADEFLWTDQTNRLSREWRRWKLLARALCDYDIIHFNFGMSFMPQATHHSNDRFFAKAILGWLQRIYLGLFELTDLAWLRWAGKCLVVTYLGDDARQGSFCQHHHGFDISTELEPGYYSPSSDAHKCWRINQFARFADRIYASNPDLLHLLPASARFLPYPTVDPRDWIYTGVPPVAGRELLVMHAPTHRGIKGTRYLLDAVNRLQQEGIAFRFRLIENMSHTEARRAFAEADLLVDQLLLGWYGGLGVELMAMGKPVVCHIQQKDLHFIPLAMRAEIPVIDATPNTIYSVLKELLTTRRYELPAIGKRSRQFVENWHDPLSIAREVIDDYHELIAARNRRSLSLKPFASSQNSALDNSAISNLRDSRTIPSFTDRLF